MRKAGYVDLNARPLTGASPRCTPGATHRRHDPEGPPQHAVRGQRVGAAQQEHHATGFGLATFAEGTTMLRRPSESDDCTQAMMMSAQLGATLELGDDAVAVHGVARPAPRVDTLTPGESGLERAPWRPCRPAQPAPRVSREGTLASRSFKVGPRRCVLAGPR